MPESYIKGWDWNDLRTLRGMDPIAKDPALFRLLHTCLERYPRRVSVVPAVQLLLDLKREHQNKEGQTTPATVRFAIPERVWTDLSVGVDDGRKNLLLLVEIERTAAEATEMGIIIPG